MDYEEALSCLKDGYRVTRKYWATKKQYIVMVFAEHYRIQTPIDDAKLVNWIGIKTGLNTFGPYTPSNCDQLATDWEISRV